MSYEQYKDQIIAELINLGMDPEKAESYIEEDEAKEKIVRGYAGLKEGAPESTVNAVAYALWMMY